MRLVHRRASVVTALLAGLAFVASMVGATPAAAATWTLSDHVQRICVDSEYGANNIYVLASVTGHTDGIIHTGVRNLPPNSVNHGGTIYPDELNTHGNHNGFVFISVAPNPVGLYTAEIWANDGYEEQTAPLEINIAEDC